MIIAIDGPSGAGKSTVSDEVAKVLNFAHLDTGAMFRAVAYMAIINGIDFQDEEALEHVAKTKKIEFVLEKDNPAFKNILIGGIDVTNKIRNDEVNKAVTPVCKHAKVRRALLVQQQEIGLNGNYVVDGRDIGTVVFPDAQIKVFLTASPQARANRRVLQNKETGIGSTDFEEVLKDINRRDMEDSNRDVAPLCAAKDAVIIDSTSMNKEEVVNKIVDMAEEKM